MLALMPALCTCGADERFRDSKRNVGFEPKIALLDRFFKFAVCRVGNQKDAESYGNRIEFSYRGSKVRMADFQD